ncbi:hypothetical protein B0H16DRAFT_1801237 [Mycena metata]|uniref:Uncharacterized protein n=1 Tax=Mycena metata TaxID=1033252 RepID=A0AAD7JJ84_9AGAR|nr:hypothetical protein B0H16DRAFT_1801237 [Mycena metata]
MSALMHSARVSFSRAASHPAYQRVYTLLIEETKIALARRQAEIELAQVCAEEEHLRLEYYQQMNEAAESNLLDANMQIGVVRHQIWGNGAARLVKIEDNGNYLIPLSSSSPANNSHALQEYLRVRTATPRLLYILYMYRVNPSPSSSAPLSWPVIDVLGLDQVESTPLIAPVSSPTSSSMGEAECCVEHSEKLMILVCYAQILGMTQRAALRKPPTGRGVDCDKIQIIQLGNETLSLNWSSNPEYEVDAGRIQRQFNAEEGINEVKTYQSGGGEGEDIKDAKSTVHPCSWCINWWIWACSCKRKTDKETSKMNESKKRQVLLSEAAACVPTVGTVETQCAAASVREAAADLGGVEVVGGVCLLSLRERWRAIRAPLIRGESPRRITQPTLAAASDPQVCPHRVPARCLALALSQDVCILWTWTQSRAFACVRHLRRGPASASTTFPTMVDEELADNTWASAAVQGGDAVGVLRNVVVSALHAQGVKERSVGDNSAVCFPNALGVVGSNGVCGRRRGGSEAKACMHAKQRSRLMWHGGGCACVGVEVVWSVRAAYARWACKADVHDPACHRFAHMGARSMRRRCAGEAARRMCAVRGGNAGGEEDSIHASCGAAGRSKKTGDFARANSLPAKTWGWGQESQRTRCAGGDGERDVWVWAWAGGTTGHPQRCRHEQRSGGQTRWTCGYEACGYEAEGGKRVHRWDWHFSRSVEVVGSVCVRGGGVCAGGRQRLRETAALARGDGERGTHMGRSVGYVQTGAGRRQRLFWAHSRQGNGVRGRRRGGPAGARRCACEFATCEAVAQREITRVGGEGVGLIEGSVGAAVRGEWVTKRLHGICTQGSLPGAPVRVPIECARRRAYEAAVLIECERGGGVRRARRQWCEGKAAQVRNETTWLYGAWSSAWLAARWGCGGGGECVRVNGGGVQRTRRAAAALRRVRGFVCTDSAGTNGCARGVCCGEVHGGRGGGDSDAGIRAKPPSAKKKQIPGSNTAIVGTVRRWWGACVSEAAVVCVRGEGGAGARSVPGGLEPDQELGGGL